MDETATTKGPIGSGDIELLAGRYKIKRRIGGGGQADAFLGEDTTTGQLVFIKQIIVDKVDDWKTVELFERETQILEQLDHRAIPAFIDGFHEEANNGGERFVLVQKYVEGASLEEMLESGERFTEEVLVRVAAEILEILVTIHERKPPLIHRDIKPSNIMRRDDDRYVLVDFGTVRVAAAPTDSSTMVGTVGYTPFEQLAGQVRPASDQYALGATLIHLASSIHPGELAGDGMTIDFQERVRLGEPFVRFIEKLVEPRPEDRFRSSRAALESLQNLDNWAFAQSARNTSASTLNSKKDNSTAPRPGPEIDESTTNSGRMIIGITILGLAMIFILGSLGIMLGSDEGVALQNLFCCFGLPLLLLIAIIWVVGGRGGNH